MEVLANLYLCTVVMRLGVKIANCLNTLSVLMGGKQFL